MKTKLFSLLITINVIILLSFNVNAQSPGDNDAGFNVGTGADGQVFITVVQSDGKIIIGGNFTAYNGTPANGIARLNVDGSIDATFNMGTGAVGWVRTAAIQGDGKIIIGGDISKYNGTAINRIARLNTDGTLDGTFNPGINILGGSYQTHNIYAVLIQNDGKIIAQGEGGNNGTSIINVVRLNSDGTSDGTFYLGAGAEGYGVTPALQGDGKIILGGNFTKYNGTPSNNIARLNTDGTIDGTFNAGTGVNGFVSTVAIQSDDKIIIGGGFTNYNGTSINNIARLNTDGSIDGTFNAGTGVDVGAIGAVGTIAIQNDGKIIIAGAFQAYNGIARENIASLNADGTLDIAFNPGTGSDSYIFTTALQNDGKVIIGGNFTSYNGVGRNRVARIIGHSIIPAISVTITVTNVVCNGSNTGSASASVSGGTVPYTYLWNNGGTTQTISGLAAGNYSVIVTDAHGTTATNTAAVTVSSANPVVADAGLNQTVYYGYSPASGALLTGTASGGVPPYTYGWNTGATTSVINVHPTTGKQYAFTVTDANGCTALDVVKVCVVDVRCEKRCHSATNKVEVCHRSANGKMETLCIAPSAVQAHLAHGDNLGKCGTVTSCSDAARTDVEEEDQALYGDEINLTSYPNPFYNETAIRFSTVETGQVEVAVYNMLGVKIATLFNGIVNETEIHEVQFNASDLSDGIYFVKLITEQGNLKVQRLVLNR